MCGVVYVLGDGRRLPQPEGGEVLYEGPGPASLVAILGVGDDGRDLGPVEVFRSLPLALHPGDSLCCRVACPVPR